MYAGKRANLTIGNIKPIGEMPEGTIICNVESVSPVELQAWQAPPGFASLIPAAALTEPHRSTWWKWAASTELPPSSARAWWLMTACQLASSTSDAYCAEQKAGDRGSLARTSGGYAIVVAHNPDVNVTRIKLPSGSKKVCHARSWQHMHGSLCACSGAICQAAGASPTLFSCWIHQLSISPTCVQPGRPM